MTSRSVSLTGATGFLGWHIAEAFVRAGWRVRAIVRPGNQKALPAGVDVRESALHAAALRPAIDGTDVVVHSAALIRSGNEDVIRAVNLEGTRAVLDAANDTGTRLVFISSLAAAGTGTREHPARESDPGRPLTAYGRSKLAAEQAIKAGARVPWTILRPTSVYGPRDRQFLQLLKLAARGRFLLAARPDASFMFVEAGDCARAVLMAAESPKAVGETFFVGHPEPLTSDEFLATVAAVVGRPYRPRRVPQFVLRAMAFGGDIAWRFGIEPLLDSTRLAELQAEGFVCSVDRARDVMGFTAATPLREGLERTLAWYRQNGWM